MHTVINYVVYSGEGRHMGLVKNRADIQQLLNVEEVPCLRTMGAFCLDAKHIDSLSEVDFKAIEDQHNVTFMPDLSVVHYDVYDKESSYKGRVSTRQDLLSILKPEQIVAKYETYALQDDDKNSLNEIDIREIENQTEMTFVLLSPVGAYGFRA